MVSLTTTVLLIKAAKEYVNERKDFSKEEIVKKINEIKYLSAQKKIPKLTLRKEIIHLESKLQQLFELEKKLLQLEKKESAKIQLLKKEIAQLKKRIAASEDRDLQKKVDTLSDLLGESLAKQAIIEEVALTKKVSEQYKQQFQQQQKNIQLINKLLERLTLLKTEVMNKEKLNPELAKRLEDKINLLQQKLTVLLTGKAKSETPVMKEELPPEELPEKSQHTLIFHAPKPVEIDELALERELPLPPPPKMEVR